MTADDIAALHEGYEGFARGDWWSIAQIFDPDIEFRLEPGWMDLAENGVAHGLQEVADIWLKVLEPWDLFWMEAREFVEIGDTMVVVSTQRGRLKGMDNVIDRPCVDNWTFRDGRIVLHEAYLEREEALRAARSRERDRAESS
jgi:ketosteroid isomerase-like protein